MSAMLIIGVAAGLIAALLQALSYILSRHILHGGFNTPLHLLLVSHVWMGMLCWIVLPFVWITPDGGALALSSALAFQIAAYLGAQFSFFWTIRHAAASRISPLMGIKILFSALFAWLVHEQSLNLMQSIAVGLTLIAAFAVMQSAEKIPWKALLGTLCVVICFASSDLGITLTRDAVYQGDADVPLMVPVFICVLSYSVVAVLSIVTLPALRWALPGRISQWPWKDGLWYAVTWLGAMVFLFTAFAFIGLVFGAIAQSLRGPFSVMLAALVSKLGFDHIEQQRSRSDYIKQIASALLMVAAIALYCLS